jgi:uncharacterized protein (UPF0276 family)
VELPDLGVGIIWWPAVDALCHVGEGLIDVIELEPESFWVPNADGIRSFPSRVVDHLPQPKVLHGVGAPLGGTCVPPVKHLTTFASDVLALRPEYVSEHLSFTHYRETSTQSPLFSGFLLPPLQSASGVALAVDNIRRRRAALGGIPLAIETPVSYLPTTPDEWTDGDFVSAVAEQADCGILLDLHNVWCNSKNGRQDIAAFCNSLPLERVWEVHLAGGEYHGTYYLDAHPGLVAPELLEFCASLAMRIPRLRAITFEIMPDRVAQTGLQPIARQFETLRDIWNTRGTQCGRRLPDHNPHQRSGPPVTPETWELLLGMALRKLPQPPMADAMTAWWKNAMPAVELYRTLVGEARASALVLAAPRCTRLLLRTHGGVGTRSILADFWRESPPGYMSADEATAFIQFLEQQHGKLPGLQDATMHDREALKGVEAVTY